MDQFRKAAGKYGGPGYGKNSCGGRRKGWKPFRRSYWEEPENQELGRVTAEGMDYFQQGD